MNKKLLALAIGAALASPAAFAASGNVDIYGVITGSVDYLMTDEPSPADDNLLRVSSNSSRIGFKGSEDLGDGLKAVWQIESQFNVDGVGEGGALAGSNFSSGLRNTFIGLAGGFGTAILGKHDTPYKLATGKLDVFSDSAADYNNIVGNVNGANTFDLRPGNVLAYISPTFSGFHAAVAYVAGQETSNGSTGDFDAWSALGMYENGPLFASLAYETHNNYNGADDRDAWKLGLGYSFGDTKVGFIYESLDDDAGATATDRNAWYINVGHKMGNITLKAAYGNASDGDTAADTSATTWAIGADYNFSKRTLVYALYAQTRNDAGGTYSYGTGQGSALTVATAGADPSVISLGMRHSF